MASRKQVGPTRSQDAPNVTAREVATFDRLKSQLRQLYDEISALSKKSPDGAVNKFKLGFVNEKLDETNELLGNESKPFKLFTLFDVESLPTNSDVVMMLSLYLDALETWRSGRIRKIGYEWCWNTDDDKQIGTDEPTRYINR